MQDSTSIHPDSQYALEIWKAIPGYEGIYQASTLGRFRSMIQRRKIHIGDILQGSQLAIGYRYIRLTDANGVKKRHSAHRLILQTFDPLKGWEVLDVNHKNGIKWDNRVENLEWCTTRENIQHAMHVLKTFKGYRPSDTPKAPYIRKGHKKGEAQPAAKLNAEKVREIRRLCDTGMSQCKIATMFGVSNGVIGQIKKRKAWSHIE